MTRRAILQYNSRTGLYMITIQTRTGAYIATRTTRTLDDAHDVLDTWTVDTDELYVLQAV